MVVDALGFTYFYYFFNSDIEERLVHTGERMIYVQAARFSGEYPYIMSSEIRLNKGGFAQGVGEHQNNSKNDIQTIFTK